MKKTLALLLALLTVIGLLAGCAKDPVDDGSNSGSNSGTNSGTNTGSNTGSNSGTNTGTTPDPKPAEPWTYYFVRTGEETTLNPHDAGATNTLTAVDRCAGMLYYYIPSEDGTKAELVPIYAESEPTVAADGVTWTIKLKKDMKWPDGEPITADDWIYSWKMMLDPKLYWSGGSSFASNYITIKGATDYYNSEAKQNGAKWEDVGIKKVDDYTITIECTATYTAVELMRQLYLRGSGLVKEEIYSKCISADGTTCDYGTTLDKLAFAGQFTVESWTKGVEIIYKKNPAWPLADMISIDTVVSRVVADESTRLELFEKGECDHIELGTNGMAKYGEDPRLKEYGSKTINTIEVNQNHTDPQKKAILSDPMFRQALFYAIDRNAIAKLNNAQAAPYHLSWLGEIKADGTLYRDLPEAKALVEKWAPNGGYDPDKANQLLDTVLKKTGQTKVTLDFMYTEGNEGRRMASEYLDAQFDVVFGGKVDLQLRAVTDAVLKATMKESLNGCDTWDLGWSGWGLAAESFYPWQKLRNYTSTYSGRYTAYQNTKLDEIYAACLLDENRLNEDNLCKLTVQGEEAWYEDMTSIPVYSAMNHVLYKDHIDLPLTQYTAQIGFGWMYSTQK